MIGERTRKLMTKIIIYLVLTIGVFIFAFPFYIMISGSLKSNWEIVAPHPTLLFKGELKPENYSSLFKEWPYLRNLFNSLFVSLVSTFIAVFFCSLAGFSFAKYSFPGRKVFFIILLLH